MNKIRHSSSQGHTRRCVCVCKSQRVRTRTAAEKGEDMSSFSIEGSDVVCRGQTDLDDQKQNRTNAQVDLNPAKTSSDSPHV